MAPPRSSPAPFVLDNGNGNATPRGGTYTVAQGPPPPYRTGPYVYTNGRYGTRARRRSLEKVRDFP